MSNRKYTTVTRICEHCQQPFEMPVWRIKQGTPGKFCSPTCHNLAATTELRERFRKYLGETTSTGCILWTGMTDKDGYGRINAGGRFGRQLGAHRVAYELVHGTISDSQCVLHSCDNPPCVNVEHLFLGTNTDNKADCVAKGRQARKLTFDQVREIRRLYDIGYSQNQIARMFGIDSGRVCRIVNRKLFRSVE